MTKYGVFIIESLKGDDFFDGETLNDILELSQIPSKYNWAENAEHFKELITEFHKSKFRYLHLSCHANQDGIEINGEFITNQKLKTYSLLYLRNKRVFLSACKGANLELASNLIVSNKALSVIGTPINLRFDKSVLFWPSFYHAMNEIDSNKMIKNDIVNILRKCVDLFEIPINFYNRHGTSKSYLWRLKIRHNKKLNNRLVSVKGL